MHEPCSVRGIGRRCIADDRRDLLFDTQLSALVMRVRAARERIRRGITWPLAHALLLGFEHFEEMAFRDRRADRTFLRGFTRNGFRLRRVLHGLNLGWSGDGYT